MRQIPKDFVVTMSDHGRHKYLVEIRENGRLLLRRWPTVDEVILENAVGRMIDEVRSPYFRDSGRESDAPEWVPHERRSGVQR